MISKRKKGSENELKIQKFYESQSYIVHRAYPSFVKTKTGVFVRSNDVFTIFDMICKKKGKNTRWVQVTTGPRKAEKEAKVKAFPDIWSGNDVLELWLSYGFGRLELHKSPLWKRYLWNFITREFDLHEEIQGSNPYIEIKE